MLECLVLIHPVWCTEKYIENDQIKEDERGRLCSTQERDEKCIILVSKSKGKIQIEVLWVVKYDLVVGYQHFGGPCCLHLQGEVTGDMKKKGHRYRLTEAEESLRRSKHRQKDNIRVDLRVIGWEGVEWIHLAQERNIWLSLVNMVINIWVP
jgi:hypothetical protein